MDHEDNGKRILIVDDDPNIRRFLTESLRLRGYDVQSYETAETALQQLESHSFDLALLDILLPGTNGLQLCRKLRDLPATKELPIIMMTAFYKQADHIRDAREQYGATDYLLKPFPLKTLHEKIDALIGAPAASPSSERLSVEGNLTETSLAHILHNLYSLRTTGLLHIEHGDVKKVVYIRNGYPIFVRSNLVREFLGQILIRKGTLTAEELEQSLQAAKEQGRRHGMILIEMGLLTPQQLDDTLRNQVTEKLLDTFSWAEGSYRFIQVREFKEGVTSIDLSPANLILQGLREYADNKQLLKALEPHLDLYMQQAENPLYRFQEIRLSVNEQRIFESCQGQITLKELLKRNQLSKKEAEPLFAALISTGILVGRTEAEVNAEAEGCEVPQDFRSKRAAFLKEYTWMMGQDYFTLLGVSKTDSREQVRKSYYNMVKKYHPDRFFEQAFLIDLKDKVNTLFQRISDAHDTLSDEKTKTHYLNELKDKSSNAKTNLENILQAETAFQKGMLLLQVKKYEDAAKSFTEALELNPNEIECLLYHAWTTYKSSAKDKDSAAQARTSLLRAVTINPKLSQAHLYLGHISKDEGNAKKAQRSFEKAIQCNPNCTEALRELRLLNMRKDKTENEKKGLFGKIFK